VVLEWKGDKRKGGEMGRGKGVRAWIGRVVGGWGGGVIVRVSKG